MKNLEKNIRLSIVSASIFVFMLLVVNISDSFSQNSKSLPVVYGSNLSQSFNGTEYNSNFIVSFNMVQGRRSFELGLLVDNRDVVSGAEFVHKFYLNKKVGHNSYNFGNYNIRPYVIYNLVYHRATSRTQLMNDLIIDGESTVDLNNIEEKEKVTTIEHYLGFGLEKDIVDNLFVSVNGGLGIYLGKNNGNNKVDPNIEQRQENGFTWTTKLSFGYRF